MRRKKQRLTVLSVVGGHVQSRAAAEQTALPRAAGPACGRCSLAPACPSVCSAWPSCPLSPCSWPRTPSLSSPDAAAGCDALERREGESGRTGGYEGGSFIRNQSILI